MIITLDGQVATGKSTIAKKLAKSIGFIYFDTGAMYRALTYAVLKHEINPDDEAQLKTLLDDFKFDIKVVHGDKHYYVNGEDVTDSIRLPEITAAVSKISAIKAVREHLVTIQRESAKSVNAVFEGRDMGTVVFPDAYLKIFLTGRPEVRAKRRFDELKAKFPNETATLTLEQCMQDINERDSFDASRENSPMVKAKDAFEIDTSDFTLDEVVTRILEVKDSIKTKRPIIVNGK
jgi:CMP/dCMP kinase